MSVKLTTKLLKAIKAKRPGSCDMDIWVASEMERLNGIHSAIQQLNAKIDEENKQHKKPSRPSKKR